MLRAEQPIAIEKCREVVELSIQNVAATAELNQLCGWHAVWWTFQASLVPLLGLFLNNSTADDPRASIESCQAQFETAMMTLARMSSYGHTAKRSLDAVSRIFEASKRRSYPAGQEGPTRGMSTGSDPTGRDASAMAPLQESALGDDGIPNPLTDPLFDDSGGQSLWDYLSCRDHNLCPEFVNDRYGQSEAMALLTPQHENAANSTDFEHMLDSGYFLKYSVPFY